MFWLFAPVFKSECLFKTAPSPSVISCLNSISGTQCCAVELNKRVKGKDNLKDSQPDNKGASPNNEQLELAFFSPVWGG